MSQTIFEFYAKLQTFNSNLPRILDEIVESNEPLAIKLTQTQLSKGKMPDMSFITPSYASPLYSEFKHILNSKPGLGVPDLNLTGKYQSGIKLDGKYPNNSLSSSDSKAFSLKEKYGDPLGHDKNSQKTFRNANDLKLVVRAKKDLGL